MKIIKSLFAFATFFAFNSTSACTIIDKWPQIKAYHEVISKTFNSSDQVNINSVKTYSELLLKRAEALSIEGMPEEFRSPKLIESLVVLKKETKHIHDLVQNQSEDDEITKALTKLNSTFHKIIEMCKTKK